MKVEIAKYAGFCMGVDLALKKLDKAIEEQSTQVATIGPIIHNPQVLKDYADKGVKILNNLDEIQENMLVVIRAHGIPKSDEEIIVKKAKKVIDATCPKVKNAQNSVYQATKKASEEYSFNNSMLLLYGEEEHPEVRSILSYSEIPYIVFAKEEVVFSVLPLLNKNIIIAAQTTQDKDIFNDFCTKFKEIHEGNISILDTICDATKQRQESVRELTNHVDAVIVVGGKTSANTRRLAEIVNSYNLPTYHIESLDELKKEELNTSYIYGLTAGASTPKKYINEVKNYLEEKL